MGSLAEWVVIALSVLGSAAIWIRTQQHAEDQAKILTEQIGEINKSMHDLNSTVQSIKNEVTEIRSDMRNRNGLMDERHMGATIDLEELKGTFRRHESEINSLKVWQAGADERLKIDRERSRGGD